ARVTESAEAALTREDAENQPGGPARVPRQPAPYRRKARAPSAASSTRVERYPGRGESRPEGEPRADAPADAYPVAGARPAARARELGRAAQGRLSPVGCASCDMT